MQYTENLNLNKPEYTDMADVAVLNDNADIIDAAFAKLDATLTDDFAGAKDYTDDIKQQLIEKIDTKVSIEDGKGLSTNDFANDYKTKLDAIDAEANKYILPVATSAVLGGVKVTNKASGVEISADSQLKLSNYLKNLSSSKTGDYLQVATIAAPQSQSSNDYCTVLEMSYRDSDSGTAEPVTLSLNFAKIGNSDITVKSFNKLIDTVSDWYADVVDGVIRVFTPKTDKSVVVTAYKAYADANVTVEWVNNAISSTSGVKATSANSGGLGDVKVENYESGLFIDNNQLKKATYQHRSVVTTDKGNYIKFATINFDNIPIADTCTTVLEFSIENSTSEMLKEYTGLKISFAQISSEIGFRAHNMVKLFPSDFDFWIQTRDYKNFNIWVKSEGGTTTIVDFDIYMYSVNETNALATASWCEEISTTPPIEMQYARQANDCEMALKSVTDSLNISVKKINNTIGDISTILQGITGVE